VSYPYAPLVDGDIIAYRSSAACKDDEEVSHALHNVKVAMQNIVDLFDRGLEQRTYLTGSDNYREKLATIQPYKGNRKDVPRPKYLPDCREYLCYAWGATIVEGREADDALACTQYAAKDRSTCIVTIDKDILYGVPGWKYHFLKGELFYTTIEEADKFFYQQVLTGDRTDNIRGIEGVGEKKAQKILAGANDVQELYKRCLAAYTGKYGPDGERQMHETASLVWIQRKENELWQPPML
jgi:DNA polymerase I